MFNLISKSFNYGNNLITLETGMISRKSDSSVLAKMGDTVVLINIVQCNNKLKNNKFLPLTVNYYERSYAVGRFPGGFLRREIRQTENEIIISRLIDRSIRPLFNKNYFNEIQITVTALSIDSNVMPDIISIIGVSAALEISEIPFNGPVSSCRVGYINKEFILNPTYNQLKNSDLDLIISCTKNNIIMIESSSNLLSNNEIIESIKFGFYNQNEIINYIEEFNVNKKTKNKEDTVYKNPLYYIIYNFIYEEIKKIYNINDYNIRKSQLSILKNNICEKINKLTNLNNIFEIENIFYFLEKNIVRNIIINKKLRIDNRNYDDIREINAKVSILPRVHGSSLFTRGETQALVSVTLNKEKNSQNIEDLLDSENNLDRFIFHYNFPPYCVGEIGLSNFPKRREIGHGKLAKKSILPILPNIKDFPYAIRIVSEITESNGSSSMASVCGASLSLMDAGVPIKTAIAGIAMGLIVENNNEIILTDISGNEDSFGDIDFKISGDENNITSLQMDVKIYGIKLSSINNLLIKSKISRTKILDYMKNIIPTHRSFLSEYVHKIHTIKIDKYKIKDIIGKGGCVIKDIMNKTKSSIDINDDGIVNITSINNDLAKKAINYIEEIITDIYVDQICIGIITKITSLGLFLLIKNNKEGLIHISYLNKLYSENIINNFRIGQKFPVKIIDINKYGKVKLIFNKIIEFKK